MHPSRHCHVKQEQGRRNHQYSGKSFDWFLCSRLDFRHHLCAELAQGLTPGCVVRSVSLYGSRCSSGSTILAAYPSLFHATIQVHPDSLHEVHGEEANPSLYCCRIVLLWPCANCPRNQDNRWLTVIPMISSSGANEKRISLALRMLPMAVITQWWRMSIKTLISISQHRDALLSLHAIPREQNI